MDDLFKGVVEESRCGDDGNVAVPQSVLLLILVHHFHSFGVFLDDGEGRPRGTDPFHQRGKEADHDDPLTGPEIKIACRFPVINRFPGRIDERVGRRETHGPFQWIFPFHEVFQKRRRRRTGMTPRRPEDRAARRNRIEQQGGKPHGMISRPYAHISQADSQIRHHFAFRQMHSPIIKRFEDGSRFVRHSFPRFLKDRFMITCGCRQFPCRGFPLRSSGIALRLLWDRAPRRPGTAPRVPFSFCGSSPVPRAPAEHPAGRAPPP